MSKHREGKVPVLQTSVSATAQTFFILAFFILPPVFTNFCSSNDTVPSEATSTLRVHAYAYHGDKSCVTKVYHGDGSFKHYERSAECVRRRGACPGVEPAMGRTFTWHFKGLTGRKETPKFVFLFAMFGGGLFGTFFFGPQGGTCAQGPKQ